MQKKQTETFVPYLWLDAISFRDFIMLVVTKRRLSYLKIRFSLKMRQMLLNNVLFVVMFSHSNEFYPKHEIV